ncbi:hypothetical protein [Aeromonas caviae]|uniref:hypothetical protein n=1 Tax=Aeromonas caviae TaxID=648 RepID=UPI00191C9185|nr:hypothetical protein [Aeromonas caviae]MBL0647739.1 hypothetical protein [Aeromonas caviae]
MKKSLIALAIAGLSFNAAAVTFDNDGKVTAGSVPFYAAELKMPVVLKTGAIALDVSYPLKKAVANTEKTYIRFDLTNAVFSANVIAADVTAPTSTKTVMQGGKTGEKFVIVEVAATDDIAANAALVLDLGTVQAQGGDASVKVSQFDQLLDAVAGTGIVDTKSGNLFELKKLTVAADKGGTAIAKASEEFKLFAGKSKDASLGFLNVGYFKADGSALGQDVYGRDGLVASLFDAKSVVTVAGDFSAVAKDKDGKLDVTKVTLGALKLTKLEGNKATFEGVPATGQFKLTVDGVTPMVSQDFAAGFAPVVNSDYDFAAADLGTIGQIQRDGTSDYVQTLTAPNSAYQNYIRLTNDSGLDGKVTLTVINNAGESKVVSLGALVNGGSDTLKAGASTDQISVKAIAEAAGITAVGDNKLRIVANGEMPSGLQMTSFIVSKDGQNLSSIN